MLTSQPLPTDPPASNVPSVTSSLQQWRVQALNWMLIAALVAATPTMLLTGINAFQAGRAAHAVIYTVAYLVVLLLTVARQMSFPVRAGMLLLLCYGMGVTALGVTSLFGTGPLYLMALVLLAVFLFGQRSGIGALLLSIPTMLWAARMVLVDPEFTPSALAIVPTPASLGIGILTFLGIGTLLLVTIVSLVTRLSQSVQTAEAAAAEALHARRQAEQLTHQAEAQSAELARQMATLEAQYQTERQLRELVTTLETPTVPIAQGVLLAPLVGTIDSRRAQTLTERLLHDVQQQRTTTVLLDITGVAVVDAGVAGALVATAQSLQLLGCAVVLTGVSPQTAAMLLQSGMRLDGIRTARSPQEVLHTTHVFSRV